MPKRTYLMTATAESHFFKILRYTKQQWGVKQAEKYRISFLQGLQDIADNCDNSSSYYRAELAKKSDFFIHLVEQHYVAFQKYKRHNIIIVGIFHKNMDIPNRLQELQNLTKREIDAIKRAIR